MAIAFEFSKRTLAAAIGVVIGVSALTACQQPSPQATVSAGNTFTSVDAQAYCRANTPGGEINDCRPTGAKPTAITIKPGTPIGVQIPPDVRKLPWYVRVIGVSADGKAKPKAKAQDSQPLLDRSYVSLTPSFAGTNALLVEVLSLNVVGTSTVPVARWQFVLHAAG